MKALVKKHAEPGLWLDDIPEPTIGINDVLIKVRKTGICGTDLHIYKWDAWAQKTIPVPMVVGHEFVGEIVEVGSNVADFHPGEIVTGEGHVVCGRCRNCLAGRRHLCADTQGVGVNRPGAFAEYISLPMTNVWHHAPDIDEEVAAIFDPFGNAVHTALSFDLLGEDVLITGAGPIGVMAAAVVRHAGAQIRRRHRCEPATGSIWRRRWGRRCAVESDGNIPRRRTGPTRHEGRFRRRAGNVRQPAAFSSLLGNMAHGGKIAMLGIPDREIAIDWNTVIFNMLTIKGIYGREMYETWYKMTVMLQSGLDIKPVITHRFDYADFQKGFDAMLSGNCGKVVLNWS